MDRPSHPRPPTFLQLLEPQSDQRIASDLDVARATFGAGGLVISQSATALQFSPIGDLGTRGSTEPSSTLTLLQPLEPQSDQRIASDRDVTRATFGAGGPAISQSATALQFPPVGDLGARGLTEPPSALTLLQPLESQSDRYVAIDRDVTQAAFGVGGLCTSLSATAL